MPSLYSQGSSGSTSQRRKKSKAPTAVDKVLGYALAVNTRHAHTTKQLVKYTGLSIATVERAQIALRREGLAHRHTWFQHGGLAAGKRGKRALWHFTADPEHPLCVALAERIGVGPEALDIPS